MTSAAPHTDRPGRIELGRVLLESGALSSDWMPSFSAVDRAAFLPDLMWPYDLSTRTSACVDKRADPVAWYAAADSNVPIVTQWDDGTHLGPGPGKLSTSSSSMPSTVFSLLQDLEVDAGMRVLDVGTGTGETAALLSHRLGERNVTSIDVDAVVAATARDRLLKLGLRPEVITGDGFKGYADAAPYDRILATVGLRQLPMEWIEQTRRGGVIQVPWGTPYTNGDAVVRLLVNGEEATGPFTRLVEFMKLRAQRGPAVRPADYLSAGPLEDADQTIVALAEEDFLTGQFTTLPFVLSLRVPHCRQAVAERRGRDRPVWFYSLTDTSWACVMFRDGQDHARVWQSGSRRLWDEVREAYDWWKERGSPDVTRFGLTISASGQRAWLDDPAKESWTIPAPPR